LHTENGGITWTEKTLDGESAPTRINCIFYIDDSVGWIGVGEPETTNPYGAIYLTKDGGQSWLFQQSFDKAVLDIHMINKDTGWAVGVDYIYNTTNGDTIIQTKIEEDIELQDFIGIFPNPTTGNISLRARSHIQVTEVNIYGKICKSELKLKNDEIDLSFLINGLYVLVIDYRTGDLHKQVTKKIIKYEK